MGNAASSVPFGAQSSQVNAVLTMSAPGPELSYRYPLNFSVTAPLVAGSGNQIYFSDAVGSIFLPDIYVQSASRFNSTQYTALVELDLTVSRAAPSAYRLSQTVSKTWNDTDSSLLSFPQAGGVLPPIGPFLLGEAGTNADLIIKYLNITFQYKDEFGAVTATLPAYYDAASQGFLYVVSSTVVDRSSEPIVAPSTGSPGKFPPLRQNEKHTIVNLPLNCTQRDNRVPSNVFNLTVGGTSPAFLKANQPFFITNNNNYFTINGQMSTFLSFLYGSNRTYVIAATLGRVPQGSDLGTGLGVSLSNASPATLDIARQFTATDDRTTTPLDTSYYVRGPDQKPETFALPRYGSLTLGPFTPGQSGTQFNLNFTTLNAFLQGVDLFYGNSGSAVVYCNTLSSTSFLSAPIIA